MKKQKEIVKNRSEILFLYDVTDANPNGDPDENKPRIDEDTQINYVTDVRFKRTIRDYLADYKKLGIFVSRREEEIVTASKRFAEVLKDKKNDINAKEFILDRFIDIRLFGCTITIQKKDKKEIGTKYKKGSLVLTGPVQFSIGRSLHTVEVNEIKGTAAFASRELRGTRESGEPGERRVEAGTFTVQYILPYALIAFHGVINENAAKHTNLTEEDISLLLDAIWNGTKNLITRSKFPQMPRLLLKIDYKEENFHIGALHKKVNLIPKEGVEEKAIRGPEDYELDFSELKNCLEKEKEKIAKIEYQIDPHLRIKGGKFDEILKIDGLLKPLSLQS